MTERGDNSGQRPRLYDELADWHPLLTPVADYADESGEIEGARNVKDEETT